MNGGALKRSSPTRRRRRQGSIGGFGGDCRRAADVVDTADEQLAVVQPMTRRQMSMDNQDLVDYLAKIDLRMKLVEPSNRSAARC